MRDAPDLTASSGLRKIWVATSVGESILTLTDEAFRDLRVAAEIELKAVHEKLMQRVCGDADMWDDVRQFAREESMRVARDVTRVEAAFNIEYLRSHLVRTAKYADRPKVLAMRLRWIASEERRTGELAWHVYFDKITPEARALAFDAKAVFRRATHFPIAESDWMSAWMHRFAVARVMPDVEKYALESATHKSAIASERDALERIRGVCDQFARVIFEEEEK